MHPLFMLRKTVLLLTTFFYTCLCCHAQDIPVNQLVLPAGKEYKLPFSWAKSEDSQYSALLIPVRFKGCPRIFYMQFDTGSPYSMLYRNKLQAIGDRYPQTPRISDTTGKLQQCSIRIGNMPVLVREMVIKQFDSTGINWQHNAMEIIGTLGTDLIDNKTVVINYPQKYMLISDPHTQQQAGQTWADLIYEKRKILLPFSVGGTEKIAFFDTGSSAYGLLTDKATALQLASPGALPTSRNVSSWGRLLTATSFKTTDSITIADKKLPLGFITYIEGVSDAQVSAMKKSGMGGMTGNALFIHNILVIDTRNKKFCIL
ncbi:hypothetical protein [Chitinophaga agri]|uniref:Peptidase A2 domain-containing protein n=1 Tax=Chitinophaga agri TaxID=2703787 RepID=A0A6B9ZQR0_9BACT|nr:hypothetical protein [Chitinophaga agri]QHS63553.1 hypothetical protein GWR21_29415 [Chitinophaga agri]